jgi:hypothetical protein
LASLSIDDHVIQHYEAKWGPASRRAQFDVRGLPIRVLVWDSDRNPEGVFLYATVGASRRPVGETKSGHRFELFAGVLPNEPNLAGALALAAAYPALFGEALGHGDTVPYEEPLWPGTQMRRMLIARPEQEIIRALDLSDGSHVEFLDAVPVYDEEVEFKAAHGLGRLRGLWQSNGVAFWDPRRERPRLT